MDLYKQLKNTGIKNIKRNRLESVGHLGSGQFGTVDKGIWHWGGIATGVALKTLKSVNELDKILFLQEAVLMAQFKHPNIICLYGVVSVGEPVCDQYMCVATCSCPHVHVYGDVYIHVYMAVYMCTWQCTCVHGSVHVYMAVYICMATSIHVYMSMYMCT